LTHDRDVFSIDEMVAAFDVIDVLPNPARFDLKKAESINGDHIRLLQPDDFVERLLPYLDGVVSDPPAESERNVLAEAAPLVQERMTLLGEARGMLSFLFTSDDELLYEEDAIASLPNGYEDVLRASSEALAGLTSWTHPEIQEALKGALVEGLGLKPRVAFGPLRVALSGRKVSPPLFESMEILGRESTMARLERLLTRS
jgi:glutamyl-tRNA synthetase